MSYQDRSHHAEDPFASTRMSFGAHLEDLRFCLWRAVVGFILILTLVFLLDFLGWVSGLPIGVGKPVMDFITSPVERELRAFHQRRDLQIAKELRSENCPARSANAPREIPLDLEVHELARELAPFLGLPAIRAVETESERQYVSFHARVPPLEWELALSEAQRLISQADSPGTLSVLEAMMVYFKVALACGVVLGSPWIFWQIWSFIAAGLYAREKRQFYLYLPFSLGLFLAGVLTCEFLVIPKAIEAMLWFNEWLNLKPELRLSEWLGFAILMPLLFGTCFQTPLVMLFLERLGIVTGDFYRQYRRPAWFVLALVAAVVTPPVDFLSMLLLWLPLGFLYELGIWLCQLGQLKPA